ncbi:PEP-CTERM sorting domain-containing protein [Phycisphaeraceae bacterium D3-23]
MQIGPGGVTSDNNAGIWQGSSLLVREGDQADGTPAGAEFFILSVPTVNASGQYAFRGVLRIGSGGVGTQNNVGIWLDSGLIAREGNQAGGTPSGSVFEEFRNLRINDSGQVAFLGELHLGGGGVTLLSDTGIWRGSTLLAREGSQAGGVANGIVFANMTNNPVISNSGHVAYRANLTTGAGGVDFNNDTGIWRNTQLIAREGSQAPGTPDGAVFSFFGSDPVLNDAGQLAYLAGLRTGEGGVTSSNNSGLWLAGINGQTLLVAREGDALAGRQISSVSITTGSGGADGMGRTINNYSQITYRATFTNGDQGVFLYTPDLHWNTTFSSSWDIASRWTLSQLPGDPHDVYIDPDVSLTVTGPSSNVTIDQLTVGGGSGIATLSLNGGTITTSGLVVESTGVLTGDGTIGTTFANNYGTVLADNLTFGFFLTNEGLVTGDGRITARFTNAGDGEVRVEQGQHLRIMGEGLASSNSGRIEVIGGQIEFEHILSNNANLGLIAGEDATFRFNGGLNNNGAVAVSFGTSRFFGDITNKVTGSIVLSGGSNTTFYDDVGSTGTFIVAAAGPVSSTAVFFGDVSGSGAITGGGTVFLHGDLRPGNSPAAVNHDVHLFLMSSATTQIELGGTTAGSQHDQINNAKSTALGGTLDIQLINGFAPDAGDTFDIFNLASSTGTFADMLLPTLDSGLGWHLGKLYTDGELHVELAGDLNQDGFVGAEDLDILLANWGESVLAFDYSAGDASGDGVVGQADLAIVQAHFGAGAPGGNVPEPGSAALLALGAMALMRRRRRM